MQRNKSVNLRNFLSTALLLGVLVSCGSSGTSTVSSESTTGTASNSVPPELPVIAVTYSVIGDIVSQLVGDNAIVSVVIPDGQDPHDFQPSAKDIETINNAALVVSNGLEFEEGLEEVLENIADAGGNIFMIGDHITVRKIEDGDGHDHGDDHDDGDSHSDEDSDEHGDKHAGGDPHIWLSPATMLEMLPALTIALSEATGADLSTQAPRPNLPARQIQNVDMCADSSESPRTWPSIYTHYIWHLEGRDAGEGLSALAGEPTPSLSFVEIGDAGQRHDPVVQRGL